MLLNVENIMDFSFLSVVVLITLFIGKINMILTDLLSYEFLSNGITLLTQFFVLLAVIYKFKRIKDSKNENN